MFNSATFTKDN